MSHCKLRPFDPTCVETAGPRDLEHLERAVRQLVRDWTSTSPNWDTVAELLRLRGYVDADLPNLTVSRIAQALVVGRLSPSVRLGVVAETTLCQIYALSPPPPDEPPAPAGQADDGPGEPGADDNKHLPPSRRKALAMYEWAMKRIPDAETMTRTELYNAIIARLPAEAAKAQGPQAEQLAELRDWIPPNAETFARYLRDAGIRRNDYRGNRRPGRSICRIDQV